MFPSVYFFESFSILILAQAGGGRQGMRFGVYAEASEQLVELLAHLGVTGGPVFYLSPGSRVELAERVLLEAA